ncbi:MAG: restriction endonuclease subunit S [Elusimicrobiota bacterium]|nr:restriction endonuclease subunit S [Elusimicrobiota bacterium]
MGEWIEKRMAELCSIKKIIVIPSKQANTLFHVYSLPAFDNERKPEKSFGREIMSAKFAIEPWMILYNKLNVRFRRIWCIGGQIDDNSVCSSEFLPLVLNKCAQGFIYYFLLTQKFTDMMDSSHTGTSGSHQRIDVDFFKNQLLRIPSSLQEQHDIAEVLASLDDKIDLLTRQNATLEELAQTYFRQWFIEDINEKYNIFSIADVSVVETGKSIKCGEFREIGNYSILGANGEIGRTNNFLYSAADEVIITGRVGTHGKVFLVNDNVWVSDNTLVIKPRQHKYRYALFFILKGLDYEVLNVGSTQPLITQTDIKKQEFKANDELFKKFDEIATPLFKKIEFNLRQIYTLQKLRDTLLPKLISGEVRVKQ